MCMKFSQPIRPIFLLHSLLDAPGRRLALSPVQGAGKRGCAAMRGASSKTAAGTGVFCDCADVVDATKGHLQVPQRVALQPDVLMASPRIERGAA